MSRRPWVTASPLCGKESCVLVYYLVHSYVISIHLLYECSLHNSEFVFGLKIRTYMLILLIVPCLYHLFYKNNQDQLLKLLYSLTKFIRVMQKSYAAFLRVIFLGDHQTQENTLKPQLRAHLTKLTNS